jgi:signal transduction histidine kinase
MASFKAWLEASAARLRPTGGIKDYLLIPALMLAIGMLMSYLLAANLGRLNQQRAQTQLIGGITMLEQSLSRRFTTYEEVLRGSAKLSLVPGGITSELWRDYFGDTVALDHYPGTEAFAYAEYVRTVNAQQPRVPVRFGVFAEADDREQSLGFNLFSESKRRAALIAARDQGGLVVTDALVLRGDQNEDVRPTAVVLYHPVFSGTGEPETVSQRRTRIIGYTNATVQLNELLAGLFGAETLGNPRAGLRLVDGTDAESTALYTSSSFTELAAQSDTSSQTVPLTIKNQIWQATLAVAGGGALVQNPWMVFAAGTVVSLLLAGLVSLWLMNRLIRTVADHELKVQEAKEELISLTSHQLRTPASGVKQYLGMVLQGYTGKVTSEQHELLKKAYNANERQLEIINQLLYVAKADAGQLRLEKRQHDLTKLVKDVVENFQDEAASKRLNLSFRRTQPLRIKADVRFVRMIIENLISNAVKYSYPGGTINLSLNPRGGRAVLRVKDKGVGISKVDEPRLFQKFSRIPNELSGEAGGAGLGLFLARQLALAHGGSLKMQSQPGLGTVFSVSLPGLAKQRTTGVQQPKSS